VTVVLAPDNSTAGGVTMPPPTRNWPARNCTAIAACIAAMSRASPSIRSLSTIGVIWRARAASAAAVSACCGLAISSYRVLAKTGSAGFGVSSAAASQMRDHRFRLVNAVFGEDGARVGKVVGSGTVGPEPITAGRRPARQRSRRHDPRRCRRGGEAPALDRRQVFPHVLISPIVAPGSAKARVTACLSAGW
jgi:hypothetical protein